jgi:rhodanese-related sulfurtransferase
MKGLTGCTAALLLYSLAAGLTPAYAGEAPLTVGGSVRACANKSKTIAVDQPGKATQIFRFDDQTRFRNVPSAKEILPGENVSIEYRHDGDDNLALGITRIIPKLPAGVGEATLKELEALLAPGAKRSNFLLIDARPASKYAAGHLPTAVSIPLPALEKQGAALLPPDRKTELIFYCGGVSCGLSHKSAEIARGLGFSKVKVYTGGEPGWNKAEHYSIPSASFLKDGNVVLVDLRQPKAAAAGHIPGAVGIPLAQLEGWETKFPSSKGAQLVFYGDKESEVAAAIGMARDWGYSNVTGFPGGIKEWQRSGFALVAGAPAAQIAYRKKLGPDEVGSADFAKELSGGVFLVDVRTPEEFAKQRIPQAINIPTEQMAKRFNELPKGKPVLFYCTTGTRAEMAFDVVKGKDYAVRFLNANVEFKEDGSYRVSD